MHIKFAITSDVIFEPRGIKTAWFIWTNTGPLQYFTLSRIIDPIAGETEHLVVSFCLSVCYHSEDLII